MGWRDVWCGRSAGVAVVVVHLSRLLEGLGAGGGLAGEDVDLFPAEQGRAVGAFSPHYEDHFLIDRLGRR